MRRPTAIVLILGVLALAGCDGDGDTPRAPATSVTAAATSATPTATVATPVISIREPRLDQTLSVPFIMSGEANTFEGVLLIDVLDNAGATLCKRHEQSTSGVESPGIWDAVVAFPPPNAATEITLRAYDFSARDGAMENLVQRAVIVSAKRPNIVITSPGCAAEVGVGRLTVTGLAQVFEAALNVDIRDANGAVMTQNVMAVTGGEFSPWSATFDLSGLYPGFYDLVAYTHSAMDGSVIDEFPIQISVGP